MFDWLRAGTFSWNKLEKKLDRAYPQHGGLIIAKLQPAHSQVIRGLNQLRSFPPDLVELTVNEPVFSDLVPDDFFQKIHHPAHDTLNHLILSRSRTSDRIFGTRPANKRLKKKPDANHLHSLLQTAYFPFLSQQFKGAMSHQGLSPEMLGLLGKNLQALAFGIAWFALMAEENRTFQEILAYWQEGNFILTMKGDMRSGTMLTLSPPKEKESS